MDASFNVAVCNAQLTQGLTKSEHIFAASLHSCTALFCACLHLVNAVLSNSINFVCADINTSPSCHTSSPPHSLIFHPGALQSIFSLVQTFFLSLPLFCPLSFADSPLCASVTLLYPCSTLVHCVCYQCCDFF